MALFVPALTVVGKSVQTNGVAHPPRKLLTLRKLFKAAHFSTKEVYQHEIANHYRDFKQQQQPSKQLQRKRRRQLYVPYRRAAFYGVISSAKRQPLATAVHYFPRFTAVYTPRGRQTLCEGAPPDETYDDTLRRITGARTCEEFKVLVERQLRLRKGRRDGSRPKSHREASSGSSSAPSVRWVGGVQRKCEKCSLKKSNDNNDANAVELNRSILQQSRQRVRSGVGHWKGSSQWHSEPSSCSRTRAPPSDSEQRKKKSGNQSLEHCVQLANEYYEQWLQSGTRYLESISARNAAQRQRRAEANAKQPAHLLTLPSTPSSSTTADTTPASTAEPTPRLSALYCFSLAHLVQLIGRKRSFRASARVCDDWAIRVNITRADESVGPAARRRAISHMPAGSHALTATQATAGMHDYLDASATAAPTNAPTTYARPKRTVQQTHFHELIDHLMQLEISDADASLPKITLTDCSTRIDQPGIGNGDCGARAQATEADVTVDSAVSFEIVDPYACAGDLTLYKNQQQQTRQGAFSLKQTKFNFHSSLELPDEPLYHSEARPP